MIHKRRGSDFQDTRKYANIIQKHTNLTCGIHIVYIYVHRYIKLHTNSVRVWAYLGRGEIDDVGGVLGSCIGGG